MLVVKKGPLATRWASGDRRGSVVDNKSNETVLFSFSQTEETVFLQHVHEVCCRVADHNLPGLVSHLKWTALFAFWDFSEFKRDGSPKNGNSPIVYSALCRWVKCLSPQNTFGVSALESNTMEVNGDKFFKCINTTEKKHKMPPYCSCGVIQVSVSPSINIGVSR